MLRAATAFLSLLLIWLVAVQRTGGAADFAIAAGGAAAAVAIGIYFSGGVTSAFARAGNLLLALSRGKAVVGGAAATARAALAGDVRLSPGLVRLKTRSTDADTLANLVTLISAVPGHVVVDTDAEGMLIHLADEADVETGELGSFEARLLKVHGAKVQR